MAKRFYSWQELSRETWGNHGDTDLAVLTEERVYAGCLQRIANSLEKIAKSLSAIESHLNPEVREQRAKKKKEREEYIKSEKQRLYEAYTDLAKSYPQWVGVRFDTTGISIRCRKLLWKIAREYDVDTVDVLHVAAMTEDEILMFPNCGPTTLAELQKHLRERYELSLRTTAPKHA